jgi:hypothetical protein
MATYLTNMTTASQQSYGTQLTPVGMHQSHPEQIQQSSQLATGTNTLDETPKVGIHHNRPFEVLQPEWEVGFFLTWGFRGTFCCTFVTALATAIWTGTPPALSSATCSLKGA